jgi:hypothetical protein
MLFVIIILDLRLIREIIIHNNQNSYGLVLHSLPPFRPKSSSRPKSVTSDEFRKRAYLDAHRSGCSAGAKRTGLSLRASRINGMKRSERVRANLLRIHAECKDQWRASALKNPKLQSTELHIAAREWSLRAPDGRKFTASAISKNSSGTTPSYSKSPTSFGKHRKENPNRHGAGPFKDSPASAPQEPKPSTNGRAGPGQKWRLPPLCSSQNH